MWIAMLVFGVSLAGLYITYVYQQSASEFTVTLSQNIPFETLAGYLTIAALILTSAVLIEFSFRLTMDTIPPILTWIGGTSVGLLLYTVLINVGLSRYPQIVVERLILEVAHVVYTVLSLVGEFYSWTLQYNGNEPVAVSTFGDSLLAVILFLTISMIAFFVATGSYKTNYVEYLVTDTWESLRENLNDESSSEEPDPERGS